jgi:hypothetical protein
MLTAGFDDSRIFQNPDFENGQCVIKKRSLTTFEPGFRAVARRLSERRLLQLLQKLQNRLTPLIGLSQHGCA